MSYTLVKMPGFAPRAAQFLDIPVGDPYGGPAYGQKLKGSKGLGMVLGVVAAVATGGAGYGAFALSNGFTFGNIAAGAMMAGGVMQGVGTITGNKKLAKVGGVLSLAGGIGTMANNLATGGELLKAGTSEASFKNFSEGITKSFDKVFSSGADAAKLGDGLKASPTIGLDSNVNAVGIAQGAGEGAGMTTPGLNLTESALTKNIVGTPVDTGSAIGLSMPQSGGVDVAGITGGLKPINYAGATGSAAQVANADKGFIANSWDKLNSINSGTGQVISGAIKAVGDGFAGSAQEDQLQKQYDLYSSKLGFEQAQIEFQKQNVNARFEYIDPSDPQAEQKKQQARTAGAIPIMFGVNKAAGPVTSNGVSMPANQVVPQNQFQVGA